MTDVTAYNANLGQGCGILNGEWAYLWSQAAQGGNTGVSAGQILWIHMTPFPPKLLPVILEQYNGKSRVLKRTNLGNIFPNVATDNNNFTINKIVKDPGSLTVSILVSDPMITTSSSLINGVAGAPVAFPLSTIMTAWFNSLPSV